MCEYLTKEIKDEKRGNEPSSLGDLMEETSKWQRFALVLSISHYLLTSSLINAMQVLLSRGRESTLWIDNLSSPTKIMKQSMLPHTVFT